MSGRPLRIAPVLAALLLLALLAAPPAHAAMRFVGSVGVHGYGYEDAVDTNHVWLLQNTRISAYAGGTPWSVHAAGGYIGDSGDDFSNSSQGRFLKGYVQYGTLGTPLKARAGRFFLYRGAAVGTFDGLDVDYALNRNIAFSLFGGLMGPVTRRFEFEQPDQALSYGGMVRFRPANCMLADQGQFAISYVNQQRDEEAYRHQVGIQTNFRWDMGLRWSNVVRLRLADRLLDKWISRARYHDGPWSAMAEFGMVSPDVSDASWFADFGDLPTRYRVRTAVNRYFGAEQEWGGGLDAQVLLTSGATGFRGGPVVITPWGRAGYRFSGGERGRADGPWAYLSVHAFEGMELFVYGARVSHAWDEFDLESADLTTLRTGARYTPAFFSSVTASAEFQVYQTPQFENDRRALGGLVWRFDTGRR